jgi:alanyl-tRNA synthetase
MLGNFSFGDYFKHDAIFFAWEFLTEVIGLPKEKLWITVFEEDDEAADIWLKEVGVDPNRFGRIGAKDNFWSMGDTGPCGPCTEIFYDHGAEIPGGPPGTPEEDGDRYIEIWNLVFMQYDRDKDGNLNPLPKPSVDTGMGLERLAAILQNGHSNYDIDLFQNLIKAAAEVTGCGDLSSSSLKVIADHIRSCSFLIVDGVMPSNEGRGYVLRRIIRRALRHGHKLGQNDPFFHKLVATLVKEMGEAYPELAKARADVERVLKLEEERFAETLDQGMKILEEGIANLSGKVIPGDMVFKLYDTYGFPVDLTNDIARERGLNIDIDGYEDEMDAQKQRARASSQFGADYHDTISVNAVTRFTGYDHLIDRSKVLAIFAEGKPVQQIDAGQEAIVVLEHTPFYAESGGQVGDTGVLSNADVRFEVMDTRKSGQAFAHIGSLAEGRIRVGDELEAVIDANRRKATIRNHSATHLMHAALRKVLGEHVQQKGSLVDNEKLRFDFSHFEAVTAEQLREIERLVNEQIRENLATSAEEMPIDDAKAKGAMALFGEKYGDVVRVVSMGDFSVELCGGTHVNRSGDIGFFKIVSESGVAAGVRRIEAITGAGAVDWAEQQDEQIVRLAGMLKGNRDELDAKVQQLLDKLKAQDKELAQLKTRLATQSGRDLTDDAVQLDGIKVLATRVDGLDSKALRDTMDKLKDKLGACAIVLATVEDDKVRLVAGVSKDQTSRIKAGELVNMVATQVGGKGGGRPDMAQAGGTQPENLDGALASVVDWVGQQLA